MKEELLDKIVSLQEKALTDIAAAKDLRSVEECRVRYLGRKGAVTALLQGLKDLSSEDRPEVGKHVNKLRATIEDEVSRLSSTLKTKQQEEALKREKVDTTLPGRAQPLGHLHPVMQTMEEIVSIFTGIGFSVHEGPEIETDYYNFEALNMPKDHPARDMQDTFYTEDGGLLRTHTSPVQIHVMEQQKPPVAIVAPGAVYRRDSDVSHSPMFHQVEGLLVDSNITFRHLKGVISLFCHQMFGNERSVRFRPSFFPFTEPSAEVDISCVICNGEGCSVCKQSGWLEILGCGMVDPNVFEAVQYDPQKYSGFAFGMGVERVAMLKYSIHDIRLFFENDIRFLEQF